AAGTPTGGRQPRAQRGRTAPQGIHVAALAPRKPVTAFDVSVGISPRQSFDSWAEFVKGLEAEGVRRLWAIDSQHAMKDVYTGLVVAALNTTRSGVGTGVRRAATPHTRATANG